MNNLIKIALLLTFVVVFAGCAKLNPATEGQIYSALEAKTSEFQKCYEGALKRDRNVKGKVDLAVKFGPEAKKPTEVKVAKSKIEDKKMLTCVQKAANGISVADEPGAFVEGSYTVSFDAK